MTAAARAPWSRMPKNGAPRKSQRTPYPAVLTREALDEHHKGILGFVAKYSHDHRMNPTMREVAKGLGHSFEWARQAVHRLVTAGFLVNPPGVTRGLRLADPDEYEAGMVDRWRLWVAELPADERAALVAALEGPDRPTRETDFSQLAEDSHEEVPVS